MSLFITLLICFLGLAAVTLHLQGEKIKELEKENEELKLSLTKPKVNPTRSADETEVLHVLRRLLAEKVAKHRNSIKLELESLGVNNLSELNPTYYPRFHRFLNMLD